MNECHVDLKISEMIDIMLNSTINFKMDSILRWIKEVEEDGSIEGQN